CVVVPLARAVLSPRPLLPPRRRRDRGSGRSLLVRRSAGGLPGCRCGLRRRPGRHPQGNALVAEATTAQQHPKLVSAHLILSSTAATLDAPGRPVPDTGCDIG